MHDGVRSGTRRGIPAVNAVLDAIDHNNLPRPLIVDIIRRHLTFERGRRKISDRTVIIKEIQDQIAALRRSRLQTVINGTGIIVHTNLGRSPLSAAGWSGPEPRRR